MTFKIGIPLLTRVALKLASGPLPADVYAATLTITKLYLGSPKNINTIATKGCSDRSIITVYYTVGQNCSLTLYQVEC